MFSEQTAQILLPIPVNQSYTYRIPADLETDVTPGRRVEILFHGRKCIGIVWKIESQNGLSHFSLEKQDISTLKLESIIDCPEENPVFFQAQLDLAQRLHEMYHYPLGKIFQLMFPAYQLMSPATKAQKQSEQQAEKDTEICDSKTLSIHNQIHLNEDQEAIFQEMRELYLDESLNTNKEHRNFPDNEYENENEYEYENEKGEILLHGITGSGKTEIYSKLFMEVLARGKSVLYMVPEINVTIQLQSRLERIFGNERLIIFHSALGKRTRCNNWKKICSKKGVIVLGTRSSVFLPIKNLSLIVIDEEHDTSYKEQHYPPLDARTVARIRSQREGCLVLFGSATPRIETVFFSRQSEKHEKNEALDMNRTLVDSKKLAVEQRIERHAKNKMNQIRNRYFSLDKRYGSAQLPQVEIVGYGHASEKMHGITRRLLQQLKVNIAQGKKNLILFNRRGYYRSVYDQVQHRTLQCPNCSVALIYHQTRKLICHYCDFAQIYKPKKTELLTNRGIQQTESMLLSLIPNLRMARLDSDQMSRYSVVQTVMKQFLDGELDILLGTQMIAKGIDFSDLEFVGVIEADAGLHVPDFRARERTFALLVQVAGRTGRSLLEGKVLFECWNPESKIIQMAAQQDYAAFYENEIKERKAHHYPPFCRLIRILFSGREDNEVMLFAQEYADKLHVFLKDKATLLGPSLAPIHKIKKNHRHHMLIKTNLFLETLQCIQKTNEILERPRKIQQLVDPDPVDFF